MLKTSISWKNNLNLFEIPNQVLKFGNLFEIWIFLSCLKHGPWGVVPCACIQVCHVVRLNTCTLHHSEGSMFEIDFQTRQTFFKFKSNFKRAIFQTFWKDDCCTKSLFFKLETSNCVYLLIFWFSFTLQSERKSKNKQVDTIRSL